LFFVALRAGLLYGTASGKVHSFDLETLAAGSFFVTRPILKHYTATRSELVQRATDVFEAVSRGELRLRIEHVYSLGEAAQAHQDLDSRGTAGKLILAP
jgi:NADPH:quinone reductase